MTFTAEYYELKEPYRDFLDAMLRNISKLVRENGIPLAFDPYGRVKELQSIEEKHYSRRYEIKNSIAELNDLVGIRMVVLFPEYVEKLEALIEHEFTVLSTKRVGFEDDRFGYSSLHMTVGINEGWKKAPEWRGHEERKLELQIRSLSEHIWAETSHTLFYKAESNIPTAIRRDNYRLKALLEVVDDKLQELKAVTEQYFESIQNCPYEEILRLDLNPHTLRRILENFDKDFTYTTNGYAILNARIEQEHNILTSDLLDKIIRQEIENFDPRRQSLAEFVIDTLDARKTLLEKGQDLVKRIDEIHNEIKKLEANS